MSYIIACAAAAPECGGPSGMVVRGPPRRKLWNLW